MDKGFWKEFYAWMDSARQGDLYAKRDYFQELVDSGRLDLETRGDAKRCIRLINQELVARYELVMVTRARSVS